MEVKKNNKVSFLGRQYYPSPCQLEKAIVKAFQRWARVVVSFKDCNDRTLD